MTPNVLCARICSGFQGAGVDLKPVTGHLPNPDELEALITANAAALLLLIEPLAPERELMDATAGRIMEGNAVIFSAADRPDKSVEEFYRLWSVLCSDGVGNYTRDVYRKTNLGTLTYWHWRPTGPLPSTPEKYGRVWVVEAQVEFAVGEYNG